jgi:hypothetical protein
MTLLARESLGPNQNQHPTSNLVAGGTYVVGQIAFYGIGLTPKVKVVNRDSLLMTLLARESIGPNQNQHPTSLTEVVQHQKQFNIILYRTYKASVIIITIVK